MMRIPAENHERKNPADGGFSTLEFVVSLAIIILLSAQILISFSGLGQNTTLTRAGQELTTEIRKAQYGALAVSARAPVPGNVTAPAIGIRLDTATPQQVIRFADRNDTPFIQNQKYDTGEQIGIYNLPGVIKINRIYDQSDTTYSALHILFQVPEATLAITDATGSAIPGNRVSVELISGSGSVKTMTIYVTGEVNVR